MFESICIVASVLCADAPAKAEPERSVFIKKAKATGDGPWTVTAEGGFTLDAGDEYVGARFFVTDSKKPPTEHRGGVGQPDAPKDPTRLTGVANVPRGAKGECLAIFEIALRGKDGKTRMRRASLPVTLK